MNLKELEQYGKTFGKFQNYFSNFLNLGGRGYNKLKWMVKNRNFTVGRVRGRVMEREILNPT